VLSAPALVGWRSSRGDIKMTNPVVGTTKKFLVVGGIAFGLAGRGLFGGVGTALADGTKPDTGTYDELPFILDEDGYQSLIPSHMGPRGQRVRDLSRWQFVRVLARRQRQTVSAFPPRRESNAPPTPRKALPPGTLPPECWGGGW
jgi:hypothetical protein